MFQRDIQLINIFRLRRYSDLYQFYLKIIEINNPENISLIYNFDKNPSEIGFGSD